MAISDSKTITSEQAYPAIKRAFKVKRPVFLWGPPGIGKSDVVAQIASDLNAPMIDLRMSQMEPTDIRGMPYYCKETNTMKYAPPSELPSEEYASQFPHVVLFLDEMNSAAPAVQASGYQLILNRRIGAYKLPDNVVIIAAGNRESDRGITYRMPTPLANRFVHIEMRPDFTSWQNWAVNNGVHKDVVGYLTFAKGDMYDFDPKSSSRAFATPRSWTFVSDLISDETESEDTLSTLIGGSVGDGIAVKFNAHRKIAAKMPNPTDILNGTVTDLKVKEVSAMYSLVVSMCYELKDAVTNKVDDKTFHNMTDYFFRYMMDNFETELVVMGARIALKTYALPIQPTKLKHFDEFHDKFGKFILAAWQQ
jgi:hypothetical protein